MKITMLDGHQKVWYPSSNTTDKKKSKLQVRAVEVIKQLLPSTMVLEEVSVPVDRKKTLYLDIFLSIHRLALEIQGQQHGLKRINFFQTKHQHNRQLENDDKKRQWCELNNIQLIYLNHDEEKQWEQILKTALGLNSQPSRD
jgi:hypothetical protein